MRYLFLAALVLTGCAAETPEQRLARWDEEARRQIAIDMQRNSPEGRADLSCRARVQFALAGMARTSFLDLERDARANQLHGTCMEHWRRTGQIP